MTDINRISYEHRERDKDGRQLDAIEKWRRREAEARERREGIERLIRERSAPTAALRRAEAGANIAEGIAATEVARAEGAEGADDDD